MKNSIKYSNRLIDSYLIDWKTDLNKKPLLIRGARQVGKSSAVRHLGNQFIHFIELNFEKDENLHRFFEGDFDIEKICSKIELAYNIPIKDGKTLLFLDEIQSCQRAILALRYFYENRPNLHIIAAGSLLEFALEELPTFGVGRIRSIFMYPFSFDEFLDAIGEKKLSDYKNNIEKGQSIDALFHQKLTEYFKQFLVIGGMPEVVSRYVTTKKYSDVQQTLDDLLISFKSDFAKYRKRIPSIRIEEIFEAVSKQMGGKFVYTKIGNHLSNIQIKDALQLLILSGLVIPVTHTSANGIPLGAEIDIKKRKMLILDTGLFQRILGLDIAPILIEKDFTVINKGAIAELFFGLEILKYSSPYAQQQLFYWHRENKIGNAEVDFVLQKNTAIIPIEIKSSIKGSMQSLRVFLKEKSIKKGVRFSLENFNSIEDIDIYPLYAVQNFINQK